MTHNTITILHLSDMQFGINHRFGAENTEVDALLSRLHDDLHELEKNDALKPDLIILTGDLTEWGKNAEFEGLFKFVSGLSQKLNISHKRIIMIPGNHDINRMKCQHYFEGCVEEGSEPQKPYWQKWEFFKRFFDKFYSDEPDIQFTEERPYSLFEIEDLKIVVAGLNSTMKESHLEDDHYGWVGEEQLKWFKAKLEDYKQRGWFRIAAVHHNVQRGADCDDENLKDGEDLKRLLKETVNLVLHGHTHQADLAWLTQKAPILATGSTGLKQAVRPEGVPNQYQLIQLQAQQLKRYCRAFIVPQKEWGWDNVIHKTPDQPFQIENIAFENINATFAVDSKPSSVSKSEITLPITRSKKIAILTANPIDKKYNYNELLKGFRKLKCEVDYFYLSCDALNDLNGYDYIFIVSKLVKNKVVIEDSDLKSRTLFFKELEENIGNTDTKGIFIFLDDQIAPKHITTLSLPTVIFPPLLKSDIEKFIFQAFTKLIITNEQWVFANNYALTLCKLIGNYKENRCKTSLPDTIDPRTTQHYVGRTTDLVNICKNIIDLRDDKNGFLTLKGSGGIGKTLTIRKIAVELAERHFFADGIDFVDCEFISEYKLFEFNIARTFNLEQAIDVKAYIKKHHVVKDALLILDNGETLLHLPDTHEIKEFINFICDYVTVVVTSREVLELDCEHRYELRRFTTDEAMELFLNEMDRKISESEQKFLRNEIIETLLDNNPLAIKLITKNLPKGKDFVALKQELETDIFQRLTDTELEVFDSYADTNIERKKSLYASINFSYSYLTDSEKIVFELLSLFPDGIHMENLRRIADEHRKQVSEGNEIKSKPLCINDAIINALDKKSIIENNSGIIRLQSIVGRFAEQKLKQRDNMQTHYRNAFDFNRYLIRAFRELKKSEERLALILFNDQKNNFLKSIGYIDAFGDEKELLLDYLFDVSGFFISICTHKNFIKELLNKKYYFTDNESQKLGFDLIVLCSRYFDGDFENVFNELNRKFPKDKMVNLLQDDPGLIERLLAALAISIYCMEGDAYLSAKSDEIMKYSYKHYNVSFFYIGEYNHELMASMKTDFCYLEIALNCDMLDIHALDKYINSLYKKNHIEITTCLYIKAKAGSIDKDVINKLVIVNPYTQGLQQLIFAFSETDTVKAVPLYEAAIDNLKHIKYYYVEGLLFYAKFLKSAGLQQQYEEIYQQGYSLAQKHYFRFLIYKFEDLVEPNSIPYDAKNYPLPDNTNFDDYINFLIKKRQQNKHVGKKHFA